MIYIQSISDVLIAPNNWTPELISIVSTGTASQPRSNHPIQNAFNEDKIRCKCTYRECHDTCVHKQAWMSEDEFEVQDEECEVVGEHVIVEDGSNTPAYDCIKCGHEELIDIDDFKKFYRQPGLFVGIPEDDG